MMDDAVGELEFPKAQEKGGILWNLNGALGQSNKPPGNIC